MGRPSEFTQEMALEICSQIMEGKSLRAICAADGMPDPRTIYRWLAANLDFSQQYARAKEDQADTLADEILNIADDSHDDYVERTREDGTKYEVIDHDHINRSRLRVDTRKWIASKLKPKKYGEKIEHSGDVGVTLSDLISKALTSG
jgi:hypothetical protein